MRLEKALDRRFFGYRSILGWNHWRRAVKKTLTIPDWLNDLAVERGINFSGVLQNALMRELNIS